MKSPIKSSVRRSIKRQIIAPSFTPADRVVDLWLDAQAPGAIIFDGVDPTIIDQFTDKSGNGNHLKQSVTARKPMLGQINGFDAVEFDGFDDRLEADTYQPFGELTVYIVATNTSVNNTDVNTLMSTAVTGGDTSPGFAIHNGSSFLVGPDQRSFQIEGQLTGTALEYTNGVLGNASIPLDEAAIFSATFDCNTSAPNVLWLGAFLNDIFYGHSLIGEIVIVVGNDTDAQRKVMTDYFMRHWKV